MCERISECVDECICVFVSTCMSRTYKNYINKIDLIFVLIIIVWIYNLCSVKSDESNILYNNASNGYTI